MKTILHNALIAGASFALAAGFPSTAQTAGQSQSHTESGAHPGAVVRGKKLDNAKVFTTQGEQMGTIEDVLLDPKTGKVTHAVLGIGGWLGIGEKRVIVPWQLVQQDPQKPENFVVNADKEKLRGAPSFEGDQWAAVTQPDYLNRVESYFGTQRQQQQTGGVAQQSPSQQEQQKQQQRGQQAQQEQQKKAQQAQAQARQEQEKQAQQAHQQANQEAQNAAKQAQQQSEQAQQQLQQAQQKAQQAAERAKQTQQAAQQTQQQLQQQQGGQVGTPQQ